MDPLIFPPPNSNSSASSGQQLEVVPFVELTSYLSWISDRITTLSSQTVCLDIDHRKRRDVPNYTAVEWIAQPMRWDSVQIATSSASVATSTATVATSHMTMTQTGHAVAFTVVPSVIHNAATAIDPSVVAQIPPSVTNSGSSIPPTIASSHPSANNTALTNTISQEQQFIQKVFAASVLPSVHETANRQGSLSEGQLECLRNIFDLHDDFENFRSNLQLQLKAAFPDVAQFK
jgi:hypothetical protein